MAEDNLDIQFNTDLKVSLSSEGVEDVIRGVKEVAKHNKKTGRTIQDLVRDYGSVKGAANALAKAYKDSGKEADKALTKTEQKLRKLKTTTKTLIAPLNEVGRGFKKLVMPASFGASLKTVDDYNKTMLGLSSSVSRLGIGITGLENNLGRVGKEMSLTRVETNKLFNDFQAGMRTISLKDFEDIMKRIRNTVGSNADAMGKMSSSIAELSQSYPSLSMAMKNLAASGGAMSSTEKSLLKTRVSNLYMIGKISDAQYKQITSYIQGNQQIGKWDSKRKKEMDAQVKAIQDFKRQWENVSMAVGQTLMPVMVDISKRIKGAHEWTEKWLGSSKKLGIALVAVMAGMGALKLGGGLLMGKMIGGSAAKGLAKGGMGGVGGIASSLKPTNVFVVGMAPGVMGKMGVGTQPSTNILSPGGIPGASSKLSTNKWWNGKLGKGGKMSGMGQMGKLKALPGGGLMTAGIMAAGALTAAGGHVLGNKMREKGKKMGGFKGYAMEAGGNLSRVGGAAAGGAMIGGRLGGPLGAAVGLAAGAIGGFTKLLWDETIGAKAASKKARQAKQDKGQFARDFKKEEEAAAKGKLEKEDTAKMQEAAVGAAGGGNIAQVFGDTKMAAAQAQAKYDEAVEKGGYEKKHEVLQDQKEKLERAKALFDEKSSKMNDDEKSGGQKVLKTMQEEYDAAEKKLKTEEENNTTLQDTLAWKNKTAAVAETIKTLSQAQLSIAEKIEALAGSRLSYLDAVIDKTALTGKLEEGKVLAAYNKGMEALKGKEVAYRAALDILESDLTVTQKKNKLMEDQSKEGKIMYAGLKEMGAFAEDEVEHQNAIEGVKTKILGITREQSDATNSLTKMYDIQLAKQEQLSTQAGLMVQLADNYAIGVGAAASMRIKQYQAEEQAINVLEDQLNMQMMLASQAGASEETKNKVYDIENKILQKQMAQAQQVKALRDGWVSAIGAMNTGAGGFTDIIMTQNKGVALGQKLAGSVEAQILGRRGAGEGYNRSERFKARRNSFGNVQGLGTASIDSGGRDRWATPFSDGRDLRFLETGTGSGREKTQELINEMVRGGRDITEGGGFALGAGDKTMGAWLAGNNQGLNFTNGQRKGMSRSKTYRGGAGGGAGSVAGEVYIDAKNVYINGSNLGGTGGYGRPQHFPSAAGGAAGAGGAGAGGAGAGGAGAAAAAASPAAAKKLLEAEEKSYQLMTSDSEKLKDEFHALRDKRNRQLVADRSQRRYGGGGMGGVGKPPPSLVTVSQESVHEASEKWNATKKSLKDMAKSIASKKANVATAAAAAEAAAAVAKKSAKTPGAKRVDYTARGQAWEYNKVSADIKEKELQFTDMLNSMEDGGTDPQKEKLAKIVSSLENDYAARGKADKRLLDMGWDVSKLGRPDPNQISPDYTRGVGRTPVPVGAGGGGVGGGGVGGVTNNIITNEINLEFKGPNNVATAANGEKLILGVLNETFEATNYA